MGDTGGAGSGSGGSGGTGPGRLLGSVRAYLWWLGLPVIPRQVLDPAKPRSTR